MNSGKGRAKAPRHYSLRQARAWMLALFTQVALLTTLACPAPDAPRAPVATENAKSAKSGQVAVAEQTPATSVEQPAIVFLGTSLTAGYGLPESEAYPALIETRLASAGLDYRVVNAGVSGDTSAGGLRRLDWLLRLPIAVLVLELGANDMLRGQDVDALESNLGEILERTRSAYPNVRFLVEGMRAAPNLGREYGEAFDAVYPRIAERFNAAFVPFFLADVVARPDLNQADGIHPTAEGHALIAERVWKVLEPLLREVREEQGLQAGRAAASR